MNIDPIPSAAESQEALPPVLSAQINPSYDDIALRAYFIALDRHRRGEDGDPLKDWTAAESQLSA